jgi:putative inorganic carbon (hco3(-)) transporter
MRDIALTSVFAVVLVMALRETWIGALLWTWFSLMNPHRLTYGFAFTLPFAMMAAGATFLSILWSRGKVRIPREPMVVLLVLFVLWTCLSTALAIRPDLSSTRLLVVIKIQLMTLVCMAALRERKHIELFVWVNVLSIGFYGFKGGIFAIATGGSSRVWGPADSFIEDNNALGLALVMIIPLGFYLWQVTTKRWLRHALLVFLLLNSVAVLATQSRGAFLAIVAMALFLWMRTRKKLLSGIVLVTLGALFIAFMPESWETRMRTIQTYQQDSSAMSRINSWETAINVANDRITGAGFHIADRQIFERYSPIPEWIFTAHSIYFQALGEQGWIGLALFLSLGAFTFYNVGRIRRLARARPESQWAGDLAAMIHVSMIGYAVGGAFLSLTYWDLPYNIMVMVIATKFWLREERWQEEKVGPFGSTSTLARGKAVPPPMPGSASPGASARPEAL